MSQTGVQECSPSPTTNPSPSISAPSSKVSLILRLENFKDVLKASALPTYILSLQLV